MKKIDFEVGTSFSSTPETSPIILHNTANAEGRIALPLGNEILDAEFTRVGRDLSIEAPGKHPLVITDYFALENSPALISETGKQVKAGTVNLLAGDPAANQFAGPVEGMEPIGTVEKLGGQVTVKRPDGSEMELKEGDQVYQNDVVQTNGDGSIGITFVDGSVFTLGNDARMTLDSMVYDPSTGEGSSSVTVMKGMFKFISGDIAANNPGDMVVETPVATIGIRGTTGGGNVIGPGQDNQFFLEPNADGTVGWFDVTTDGGTVSMNQPFQQVGISDIGAPPPPPNFTTPDALNQQFGQMTPFTPQGRYDNRSDGNQNEGNDGSQNNAEGEGENQDAAGEEGEPQGEEGPDGEEAEGENMSQGEGEAAEGEEMAAGEEGEPNPDGETNSEGEPGEEMTAQGNGPDGEQSPGEGQGSEDMGANETTEEGTNTNELTDAGGEEEVAMAGDDMFDGEQPSGDQPPAGDAPQGDAPPAEQTFNR
ncbi:MAG: FecR domain-containing protein, partial [Rickettsiales bacterium]